MKTLLATVFIMIGVAGLSFNKQEAPLRYNIVAGANYDGFRGTWTDPVKLQGYLVVRNSEIEIVVNSANINLRRSTEIVTPLSVTTDGYRYIEFRDSAGVEYIYVVSPTGEQELWMKSSGGIGKFYLQTFNTRQGRIYNYGL